MANATTLPPTNFPKMRRLLLLAAAVAATVVVGCATQQAAPAAAQHESVDFFQHDYYGALGLDPDARASLEAGAIRKQYRALTLELHPDRLRTPTGSPRAASEDEKQRFLDVTQAHEVLSDGEARERYDAFLDSLPASWRPVYGKQRAAFRGLPQPPPLLVLGTVGVGAVVLISVLQSLDFARVREKALRSKEYRDARAAAQRLRGDVGLREFDADFAAANDVLFRDWSDTLGGRIILAPVGGGARARRRRMRDEAERAEARKRDADQAARDAEARARETAAAEKDAMLQAQRRAEHAQAEAKRKLEDEARSRARHRERLRASIRALTDAQRDALDENGVIDQVLGDGAVDQLAGATRKMDLEQVRVALLDALDGDPDENAGAAGWANFEAVLVEFKALLLEVQEAEMRKEEERKRREAQAALDGSLEDAHRGGEGRRSR